MEKRVDVFWSLGSWNDPQGNDVLKVESDVGGKVVEICDQWPADRPNARSVGDKKNRWENVLSPIVTGVLQSWR
ncbi:hypothetical protein PM082_014229 [Marasmius tenuissimus]|nr:hypothetical protein PM082_014229 [Marasmius tenuissimus]